MIRLTPDTNVLAAATISAAGPAREILDAWKAERLILVTCEGIVAEFEEALRRPRIRSRYRHVTESTITSSAAGFRLFSAFVTVADVPRVVPEDPDDDVVLACTVAGGSDYLVSRDRHLLNLDVYQGIPIVTAEAFLRVFHQQVREESATFVTSGTAL